MILHTERLLLRAWRDTDREPFAQMNADPAVVEFLTGPLTRDASDALVDRIECGFAEHGFGLWAVEARETQRFIGFIGLSVPRFDAPFQPAVEIGWRLARQAWGQGYATEGARRVLVAAFETFGLEEVVSFTAVDNTRSRRVMESIGMRHDPADDFDHPLVAADSSLQRHVLYRGTSNNMELSCPTMRIQSVSTTQHILGTQPDHHVAGDSVRVISIESAAEFQLAFERCGRSVLRYASSRVGPDAAEDVANETFAAAWKQRHKFEPERGLSVEAWLIGFAHHVIQQHRRTESRWLRMCEDTHRAAHVEVMSSSDFDEVESRIVSEDSAASLLRCLRSLPPRQRSPLLMHVVNGLSYEEIASALGVPVGTVRSRINRARRKLREFES